MRYCLPSAHYFYFANLSTKLYMLFLVIHTLFIPLFLWRGIPELALFNVMSALLYAGCLWLNRHGHYNLTFVVLVTEVIIHAGLCSLFLGNAGFSQAVLFLPMLYFIHPAPLRYKGWFFAFMVGVYLLLVYHDQVNTPLHPLGPTGMQFFNMSTSFLIIGIGSYIAYYTYSTIKEKEALLEAENAKLQEQYKLVEKLSITDKLTGLFNRAKLENMFKTEAERTNRTGTAFGLIILDVDHFKTVNDTYGHHVGDTTLQHMADVLKKSVRKMDVVGRWGGEEFLVICPETSLADTKKVAEKIRLAVAAHTFPEIGHKTASFGVAAHTKGAKLEKTLIAADAALYTSKQTGRNKVTVAK
jgi:diguanylate cyclase (GGDEF)-like protein